MKKNNSLFNIEIAKIGLKITQQKSEFNESIHKITLQLQNSSEKQNELLLEIKKTNDNQERYFNMNIFKKIVLSIKNIF